MPLPTTRTGMMPNLRQFRVPRPARRRSPRRRESFRGWPPGFGLYCDVPQGPGWRPRHWPASAFNQSPRLVNLAGSFQRASIVTGFGWLTALSAQGLARDRAAQVREPAT